MVQRYDFAELTGTYEIDDNGPVVKYEDYAALQGLMFRLTDQFNMCELPDDLYEALEAAGIL